jgi:hypothetical protein
MAGIDDLIAQGPGKRDFSPLGQLFGAYREGVKARREDQAYDARRGLGDLVQPDGTPDYGAAALHLLRAGDIPGATALAHLSYAGARHELAQAQIDKIKSMQPAAAVPRPAPAAGARAPGAPVSDAAPAWPGITTRDQANAAIEEAREAIAAGADRGDVAKRLRSWGLESRDCDA